MTIPPISSAASLTPAELSELQASVAFSTRVGDKTYVADVAYSNGVYVANDPNISGAEATGSSRVAAEDGFSARIDVLG